jgi:DNA-binding SARP family transcriptional activator
MSEPLWQLQLFGTLAVRQGDRNLGHIRAQKPAELLAYLALHPDVVHPREELIERLWPEAEPEAGRNRLRQTLSTLRDALEIPEGLPRDPLQTGRTGIQLDSAFFRVDVGAFRAAIKGAQAAESAAEQADWLRQAVGLYRDELLRGWYQEWALAERERLAASYLAALRQLARLCGEAGDLEQAMEYGRRAVEADPLNEEAHCDLMHWYAASGQPSAAEKQYRELERALKAELGAEPSEATRQLRESLRKAAPAPVTTRPRPAPRIQPPPILPTNGTSAPTAPSERRPRRWLVPLASEIL